MSKVRINDLARELEVKSKAILDVLTAVGVTEKKTHSSSLEEDEAERVRGALTRSGGRERGGAAARREPERPSIDLSRVSKPGDVLRALQERQAQPAPQRPAVAVAPPARPVISAPAAAVRPPAATAAVAPAAARPAAPATSAPSTAASTAASTASIAPASTPIAAPAALPGTSAPSAAASNVAAPVAAAPASATAAGQAASSRQHALASGAACACAYHLCTLA